MRSSDDFRKAQLVWTLLVAIGVALSALYQATSTRSAVFTQTAESDHELESRSLAGSAAGTAADYSNAALGALTDEPQTHLAKHVKKE